MLWRSARGSLSLLALALVACGTGGGSSAREAGAGGSAGGDGGGTDHVDPRVALCDRYRVADAASPSFEVVQQIFDDNCATCHSTGAAVDLSRGNSFANIVNHAAPSVEACGGILIVPGDPAASYVYQKLTTAHPCAGAQMPLDELFTSQPLPDCVTTIVHDWIVAGAPGG
jgi:hypothetical protein